MITAHDIQLAAERIGPYVLNKPMRTSKLLGDLCHCDLRMKLENFQATGSFKERGAANKILCISDEEAKNGVMAASAGNHAQGVACAAQRRGIHATIVMPVGTPLIKVDGVRYWGGEVVLHGKTYDEAYAYSRELAQERNVVYIHPFADPLVIAGQGTIAKEMMNDPLGEDLDAILVPIGGGGLIAGVACYIKELYPHVQVIGIQDESAPSMAESIRAGKIVEVPTKKSIADGINVRRVAEETFDAVQKHVDEIVTVSPDEISNAILMLLEIEKIIVEGAGAVGIAALRNNKTPALNGKKVACILSGGNIDSNQISRIITRGLLVGGRIAALEVHLRDAPGALENLTKIFHAHSANILEINFQRFGLAKLGEVKVSVTIETRSHEHVHEILHTLEENGYPTLYDGPKL
ncbi:MAG: threonine ammonia-lyase [Phycisphaerales bacterium]|mgnify:CR=1 FL=1|jgi:threonine dehydratase|nr:threonine ammonia-lyase [Phycisphaerales bacterium]